MNRRDRRVILRLRPGNRPDRPRARSRTTPSPLNRRSSRSDRPGRQEGGSGRPCAILRCRAPGRTRRAPIEANERDFSCSAKNASRRHHAAVVGARAGRSQTRRDRLVCDVSEIKAVASDLDRLENGVKGLAAKDCGDAKHWAIWAERRARDFKNDSALTRSARPRVEAEAFRIETTMKRLGVDAPEEWLAMAKDAATPASARARAGGLAHRALRAQLAAAGTAAIADDHQGNRGVLPQSGQAIAAGAHEPVAVGSPIRSGPGDGLSRRPREPSQRRSTAGSGPMPAKA